MEILLMTQIFLVRQVDNTAGRTKLWQQSSASWFLGPALITLASLPCQNSYTNQNVILNTITRCRCNLVVITTANYILEQMTKCNSYETHTRTCITLKKFQYFPTYKVAIKYEVHKRSWGGIPLTNDVNNMPAENITFLSMTNILRNVKHG